MKSFLEIRESVADLRIGEQVYSINGSKIQADVVTKVDDRVIWLKNSGPYLKDGVLECHNNGRENPCFIKRMVKNKQLKKFLEKRLRSAAKQLSWEDAEETRVSVISNAIQKLVDTKANVVLEGRNKNITGFKVKMDKSDERNRWSFIVDVSYREKWQFSHSKERVVVDLSQAGSAEECKARLE